MQKQDYLTRLKEQIDSLKEKKRNMTVRFATELAAVDEELNQKFDEYYRLMTGVVYPSHSSANQARTNDHPSLSVASADRTVTVDEEPFRRARPDLHVKYQRPYFNVEKDIVPKVEHFLKQLGRPATKNEIVEYLKKDHNIAYKNPFIILKKCEQVSDHVEKIGRALYKYSEQKEPQYLRMEKQKKNNSFKTDVLPLIIEIMRERNQPVTGKEIFQTLEQKHQLVYLNYTLTMNKVISLDDRVRRLDRDQYILVEEETGPESSES
ncbi:hypothetical protein LOK74_09180 [Brevibacillus humidisoli]|uniref:Rok-like winged helix domain-containing protein n=1 Tax=Brevibacillus humidisoli TaxID=2895522 RepID=UPI001E36E1C6|nr:hypothetical protein [Brevibacillus humidisoli]UFJ42642.1 hypothetical protein LOK74_09180 [Brevibacillus humidisoli]